MRDAKNGLASHNYFGIRNMKESVYNTLLNIDDKHTIIFNALSAKFVVIRDKCIKTVAELLTISKESDRLYKNLCEAGVLIENRVDELSLLCEMIKSTDEEDEEYFLHINPTTDCNFHCWYCYEMHNPKSLMSPQTRVAVMRFVDKTMGEKNIRKFHLGFFGGEPLIGFDEVAKPLIIYASSKCLERGGCDFYVNFTSNGSLVTPEIIDYLSQFNCGFQITLDGGPSEHDKTRFFKNGSGSYAIIVNNIKQLVNRGIGVIVRINYTTKNISSIESIYESFYDLDNSGRSLLKFDFQRVWQERKNCDDSIEKEASRLRSLFAEEGFKVLNNHLLSHVYNSCYGDKLNHLLINYDGLVFGCTARDFTLENSIGHLDSEGHVHFNENYYLRRSSKMIKNICKKCRIAPFCGGGCSQRAFEDKNSEDCTYRFTQADIDRQILKIFEYSFCK